MLYELILLLIGNHYHDNYNNYSYFTLNQMLYLNIKASTMVLQFKKCLQP